VGYTGGFAIADEWLGDGRVQGDWRDSSARIEGPCVRQLQAGFVENWTEATGELLVGERVFPKDGTPAGGCCAGVLFTTPSLGSTEAERYFALSISGARERLYITNAYFIPDDDFRRLLVEAAARGVDVRVLTPGANTDKPATWYAGRHRYEELLAAGIRIWEYRPTMVHAKSLVADGVWASVGTLNFDNRSMALNDEITLLCHGAELGSHLEERFLLDLELADELELDRFRRRGSWERAKERLAVGVARVL
jgi:cardiolipin synthase